MEDPAIYQTILGLHTKTKKIVTCRYCQGKGTIEQRKFFGHTDGWTIEHHQCGVCKGRRVLEMTVEVTFREVG
jgi:DnaJ-class molecular chaperone